MKIGISACLLGDKCTWKGTHNKCQELIELLTGHTLIKICPEVMGGLSIPRHPCEITSTHPLIVSTIASEDYTRYYLDGTIISLDKTKDCDLLILKANSPSCGNEYIYDGTFTHSLIKGEGVFAHAAKERGMKVYSEKQLDEIRKYIRRKR